MMWWGSHSNYLETSHHSDEIGKNILKKSKDRALYHTGAMYSSVPTKEVDGVAGSETKLGGRYSLDLRLDVECFITWSISLARVRIGL